MIIITVYTLYLDGNFLKQGRKDYFSGPKIFMTGAQMKVSIQKLKALRKKKINFQFWLEK